MMPIELNFEKISRLSKSKADENYRFRSFLKNQDSDKIDRIVHRLHREISERLIVPYVEIVAMNSRPDYRTLRLTDWPELTLFQEKNLFKNLLSPILSKVITS